MKIIMVFRVELGFQMERLFTYKSAAKILCALPSVSVSQQILTDRHTGPIGYKVTLMDNVGRLSLVRLFSVILPRFFQSPLGFHTALIVSINYALLYPRKYLQFARFSLTIGDYAVKMNIFMPY